MKQITEYLSTKVAQTKIKVTNDTIQNIVKDELDRLGHDADLNHIDVSGVTNMKYLFSCADADLGSKYCDLNADISRWDVSKVENMEWMFYGCKKFNQDLSQWNVGKVKNMYGMFYNCVNFNQNLSQWNISNVEDMRCIFKNCLIKEEYKPHY